MACGKRNVLVARGAAVLLALAASAQAATTVQTVDIPAATIAEHVTNSSAVPYPITAQFQQLDPAQATLNQVTIAYQFGFRADIVVLEGSVGGASCGIGGNFYVDGAGCGGDGGGGGNGGTGPLSVSAAFTVPYFPPGNIAVTAASNPDAFAKFQGTGQVTVLWDTTPNISFNPPEGGSVDFYLLSPSYIKVTYDYCPAPFADADGDRDVDMNDFAAWQKCFADPQGPLNSEVCLCLDYDRSGVVERADLDKFIQCFSGPAVPADPNCVNN